MLCVNKLMVRQCVKTYCNKVIERNFLKRIRKHNVQSKLSAILRSKKLKKLGQTIEGLHYKNKGWNKGSWPHRQKVNGKP